MYSELFRIVESKNFDKFDRHSSCVFVYGDGDIAYSMAVRDPWDTAPSRYSSSHKASYSEIKRLLERIPAPEVRERNFIMRKLSENLEIAKKLDSTYAKAWRAELEAQIDRRLLEAPPENLKDVTPLLPDDEIPF